MIKRYADPEIDKIWSSENKLRLWQGTELAVIAAKSKLGIMPSGDHSRIASILQNQPIDLEWWLARDAEIRHDLQAFVDERLRHLPLELQQYFHQGMTSYDTEESALAQMLMLSTSLVQAGVGEMQMVLRDMAQKYRYTLMNGRTHGQEAELQTFGKRCLTWLVQLSMGADALDQSNIKLRYSKISGAIGNYGGIDPRVEAEALSLMGMWPFYGATQIMPRELYAPLAQALCQIVLTLDKIANDIRLGARSGRPIYREPFGKKQKGSSKMPHKKNTISTEQMEGMARLAQGYLQAIMANIKTWEERAIEQSCVERVAWPDLFHVVLHSLKTMKAVLSGLVVYPDNMIREILDSRGCYAAGEAKDWLRDRGARVGLSTEDAYRIVQLAAFNAFQPTKPEAELRANPPVDFNAAEQWLRFFQEPSKQIPGLSIRKIIAGSMLRVSDELDASEDDVARWNGALSRLFVDSLQVQEWDRVFSPTRLLQNEAVLYEKILAAQE